MKKIIIVAIGLTLLSGCGRVKKIPENKRFIREVFQINLSKDEIYNRSLEWMVRRLVSSKDGIVYQNKNSGKLIGKGIGKFKEYFGLFVTREFGYTMTIEIKEGRYRVTYENFVIYYDERDLSHSELVWQSELKRIKSKLDPVSSSLNRYLRDYTKEAQWEKEKEEKKDDNW